MADALLAAGVSTATGSGSAPLRHPRPLRRHRRHPAVGCAYVPVDHDDPDERARVVFGEADVAAIITTDLVVRAVGSSGEATTQASEQVSGARESRAREDPTTGDDAWIIFTSGSTGTPKGVAVTHRNAAAFVDAEAGMFVQDRPIGPVEPGQGSLVAFDASCEENGLAWRHGACLVPAPRSLVRSGSSWRRG